MDQQPMIIRGSLMMRTRLKWEYLHTGECLVRLIGGTHMQIPRLMESSYFLFESPDFEVALVN